MINKANITKKTQKYTEALEQHFKAKNCVAEPFYYNMNRVQ